MLNGFQGPGSYQVAPEEELKQLLRMLSEKLEPSSTPTMPKPANLHENDWWFRPTRNAEPVSFQTIETHLIVTCAKELTPFMNENVVNTLQVNHTL